MRRRTLAAAVAGLMLSCCVVQATASGAGSTQDVVVKGDVDRVAVARAMGGEVGLSSETLSRWKETI